MTNSVHTNTSALVALQNLNASNKRLEDVQGRISTGLRVQGPKDNASVWAIAQNQRSDVGALEAVKTGLDRALSLTDVTLAAGQSISDLIIEMRQKATAASDPSATAETRAAYNDEFQSLMRSLAQFASSASFDGVNLLDNSESAPLQFLANTEASDTIALDPQNFTLDGLGFVVAAGPPEVLADLTTEANAATARGIIDAALEAVTAGLSEVGAQAKQIENHHTFVMKLMDSLEAGIGNMVDADLAKESARLQALQVQQQLGAQALSIANTAPQIVLSLFRGQ